MKTLLAIDIGNTYTKYGLFRASRLRKTWQHETVAIGDQAASILKSQSAAIVVSSVVPGAIATFESICRSQGKKFTLITPSKQTIITCVTDELGADLLAAAVAAHSLFSAGKAILTIGLGTATTLTAVSSDGTFKGCYLTLGLTPTLEALAQRCALLPDSVPDPNKIGLGFDTASAMGNGALLAQTGTIEAWVRKARCKLKEPAVVVASGGWAEKVATHTKVIDHTDKHLTLKGIYLLGLCSAKS